jgi:hypothetical protein
MAGTEQRGDTFYTRGMLDFQFSLPGDTFIYCDGSCDPDFQPTNPPPTNTKLNLWPQPFTDA